MGVWGGDAGAQTLSLAVHPPPTRSLPCRGRVPAVLAGSLDPAALCCLLHDQVRCGR